jgi:hypothetical protein
MFIERLTHKAQERSDRREHNWFATLLTAKPGPQYRHRQPIRERKGKTEGLK